MLLYPAVEFYKLGLNVAIPKVIADERMKLKEVYFCKALAIEYNRTRIAALFKGTITHEKNLIEWSTDFDRNIMFPAIPNWIAAEGEPMIQ